MAASGIESVDTLMEGERELLSEALAGDAASLRALFSRYAKPLYFFILHLSGCGRDAAYDRTVSLLAERLSARRPSEAGPFFVDCLKTAVTASRALPLSAVFDDRTGDRSTPVRAASWRFVKEALARLSFDDKAFLLLRDQMCLPYSAVAAVHGVPEREARLRVERARLSLREALEAILRKREGAA